MQSLETLDKRTDSPCPKSLGHLLYAVIKWTYFGVAFYSVRCNVLDTAWRGTKRISFGTDVSDAQPTVSRLRGERLGSRLRREFFLALPDDDELL